MIYWNFYSWNQFNLCSPSKCAEILVNALFIRLMKQVPRTMCMTSIPTARLWCCIKLALVCACWQRTTALVFSFIVSQLTLRLLISQSVETCSGRMLIEMSFSETNSYRESSVRCAILRTLHDPRYGARSSACCTILRTLHDPPYVARSSVYVARASVYIALSSVRCTILRTLHDPPYVSRASVRCTIFRTLHDPPLVARSSVRFTSLRTLHDPPYLARSSARCTILRTFHEPLYVAQSSARFTILRTLHYPPYVAWSRELCSNRRLFHAPNCNDFNATNLDELIPLINWSGLQVQVTWN